MRQVFTLMASFALATVMPASVAQAQSNTPWLTPTYQSPPSQSGQVPVPLVPPPQVYTAPPPPPPPIFVPQTGQTVPNLPIIAPSGPQGRETQQDRAARCAHQSGAYGGAVGNRAGYLGSCVNQ